MTSAQKRRQLRSFFKKFRRANREGGFVHKTVSNCFNDVSRSGRKLFKISRFKNISFIPGSNNKYTKYRLIDHYDHSF